VATNAPLLPHQCSALARRVTLGLARTGTSGSHFSGDLFLALSTANPGAFTPSFEHPRSGVEQRYDELRFIPWACMDPFYRATVQAVEEAVINALVANQEMVGIHGHRVPALPRTHVVEILRGRGVLVERVGGTP
jgi:L-aminopeptidase/D-esterase-like protein